MASSYEKIPAPETTYNGMTGKWAPSRSNPDNSSWIEKPKSTKNVDPGFGRKIPKPKPRPTMLTPGRKKPGGGPRELLPKKGSGTSTSRAKPGSGPTKKLPRLVTGKEAVLKEYQKQISPKGVAKANADAKKALEKKYPGMFIPETRTTSGVKKVGKK